MGPPAAGTAAARRRIRARRRRRGCCHERPAASIAACHRPAPAPPRARPGPRRRCWRRGRRIARPRPAWCRTSYRPVRGTGAPRLPARPAPVRAAAGPTRRTAAASCPGHRQPGRQASPRGAGHLPRRRSTAGPGLRNRCCRHRGPSWSSQASARLGHGLGIRRVLLIISDPDRANSSTIGCSCHGPICHWPNQISWPMAPVPAAIASTITSTRLVGIGVPSKYVTLPSSPVIASAVTL
ncbi:hypothetical protein G6F35_015346 [Rhizopus arrhizus]|nr:hypothetical protein G6F35_015346 [Rhizopus arrhizus]